MTSLAAGLASIARPDVIYAVLPPLPLGVTALTIGWARGARVVVNIQDFFPRAAVVHGMLKNPKVIHFFERLEQWVYRRAALITVISEGMREDLLSRGVPAQKVLVVENWADPNFILPGPKENDFRKQLSAQGKYVAIYSGGINNNANLAPLVSAAELLRNEPFLIVIVGEGQYQNELKQMVHDKSLTNVQFFPFQPVETYPQVLRAADISIVSLHPRAESTSVPSKIYKQMAAARPFWPLPRRRTNCAGL